MVLPGFLNAEETTAARGLVDSVLLPLRWNDPIVELMLSSEARVARLSAAVNADDLKWISGYISIKDANSPPLWWHQDWWCQDHPVSYRREAPQTAISPQKHADSRSVAGGAQREYRPFGSIAHRDGRPPGAGETSAASRGRRSHRLPAASRNACKHLRLPSRLHTAVVHALMEGSAGRHQSAPDRPSGASL